MLARVEAALAANQVARKLQAVGGESLPPAGQDLATSLYAAFDLSEAS